MSLSITIASINYNGQVGDITFYPLTGGTINIGPQTIPYVYFTDYPYGVYDIYVSSYDITCSVSIAPPTPTPTNTPTETPTNTPTETPTNTPTEAPTPTSTPTNTQTPTNSIVSSGLIMNWDIQNTSSYSGSGSIITDLQGNINGTMTGVISYTNDSPKYLTIDGGVSEYIYTSNINPYLSPVNTGTAQSTFLWIYPTSNGIIYSEQGSLSPDFGWFDVQIQRDSSDRFLFGVWPYTINGPAPITSSITHSLNNWYYVGWTYNGTTLTAYVNGTMVGISTYSRDTPYNLGPSLPMYFNFGYPSTTDLTTTTSACSYRLGAVQIYNIGLSGAQVLQNYNYDSAKYILPTPTPTVTPTNTPTTTKTSTPSATPSIVTSNLQLQLSPSSYIGSGTVWDTTVGTTDAILSGSPTYNILSGFTFNGTTQYGRIPSVDGVTNFTNTSEYTVEIWFNPSSGQANTAEAEILEKWNQTNQLRYPYVFRYAENTGTVTAAVYDGTTFRNINLTGFPTNTWAQVVGVFNFTTDVFTLYRNGVSGGTASLVGIGQVSNTSSVGISCRLKTDGTGEIFFKGTVSIVRIYNTALSSSQVLQNFNVDKTKYGL